MKYNTFLYGGGAVGARYGTREESGAISELRWSFVVAWDGSYTGENESSRMTGFSMKRGRERVISPSGNGFEHYSPGQVVVELDNEDGRYSPFNTASPLYPNVTPGKFVRVAVRDGTGTNYELMRGIISDIQPFRDGARDMVRIVAEDGLKWLAEQMVYCGYTPSQDLDYLANKRILALADWPSTQPASGAGVGEWPREGNTTSKGLTYFWAWGVNALDAIHWLEDLSAGGVFFHQNNGQSRFLGANLSATTATIAVDQSELLRDISIRQPWEVVRNQINIVNHPKQFFANSDVLWSLGEPLYVPAGQAVTIEALFREGSFDASVSTDFILSRDLTFAAWTNSDGTGADRTAFIVATASTEAGPGVFITFDNRDSNNLYITLAELAPPEDIYSEFVTVISANDAASQAMYGKKSLTIDVPFMQNTIYAQEVAAYLLERFKDPQPYPVVKVEARPALQYVPDLYRYKFALTLAKMGISQDFRVGGIAHQWANQNGQKVITTFWLEPAADVFVFS